MSPSGWFRLRTPAAGRVRIPDRCRPSLGNPEGILGAGGAHPAVPRPAVPVPSSFFWSSGAMLYSFVWPDYVRDFLAGRVVHAARHRGGGAPRPIGGSPLLTTDTGPPQAAP